MEFRRDASMLNVSMQETDAGRLGWVGDTGLSLSLCPSRRLALLRIKCLLGRAAATPALSQLSLSQWAGVLWSSSHALHS